MKTKMIHSVRGLSLRQRWLVGGVVLVLGVLFFRGCSDGPTAEVNQAEQMDRFYEVKRGDCKITVLSRGELAAIENYKLRFEGKGKEALSIIQIVENQSVVKAGDAVVSFSDETYLERIKEAEEDLDDLNVDHEDSLLYQSDGLRSHRIGADLLVGAS